MVTDQIERVHPDGRPARVRARSSRPTSIVTATGLNLLAFGGIDLAVDGEPVHLPDTMAYKGMMLSGVPNFALRVGYTNASWTLKADLVAQYVCRLLRHMRPRRHAVVVPAPRPGVQERPFMDFASGYVHRSLHLFPKQGEPGAVAAAPELPARRAHDPARPGRRRRDGLLLAHEKDRRQRVEHRHRPRDVGQDRRQDAAGRAPLETDHHTSTIAAKPSITLPVASVATT